jgi:hypothetical protein
MATAPLLAKLFLVRWLIIGSLALLAATVVLLALAA